MPPRSAKKVVAKKGTPKSKADAATLSVEEPKVSPSTSVEDKSVTSALPDQDLVEKTPEPEADEVLVKMEVTSTTVVEETKVVEEEIDFEIDGAKSDGEPEEIDGSDGEEDEAQGEGAEGEDITADDTLARDEENGDAGDEGSESDDEDDQDPSAYMQIPLTDRKKPKDIEIFVGGLDRKAVEEDLTKVFGEYGEIQELRIVKHPVTQKSKGYAFLRYANVDQAKKVLTELKDGIEVNGKRVGISASQDSDTIYVGNICKTWTKEQVLEALKTFGIEQIDEIYLPEDPNNEGKIRGFAFLEFSTHAYAMTAFQRLRKADAVLGRDRSAKVAFAQSMHPSDEALAQVKTVYVEGLAESWGEDKLKEVCKQYGEIEKVLLSRNLVKTKRKDFGFVTFTSRESALACVEGINNAQIGEGDIKVKANLAKPEYKGRLGKSARGGFMVSKDGEKKQEAGPSKKKGNSKSKGVEAKKGTPQSKSAKGKSRPRGRGERQTVKTVSVPSKSDRNNQRNDQSTRGKKRDGRSVDVANSGRPSKKPRGNTRARSSGGYGNRMRDSRPGNARQNYGIAPPRYADSYRQGYAAPPPSYQGHAYGAIPGSSRSYSDMEPHAGYLKPSARKQEREVYGYGRRSGGGYGGAPGGSAYGGGPAPPPAYPPAAYSSYPGYGGGGGYSYPPRQGYY